MIPSSAITGRFCGQCRAVWPRPDPRGDPALARDPAVRGRPYVWPAVLPRGDPGPSGPFGPAVQPRPYVWPAVYARGDPAVAIRGRPSSAARARADHGPPSSAIAAGIRLQPLYTGPPGHVAARPDPGPSGPAARGDRMPVRLYIMGRRGPRLVHP